GRWLLTGGLGGMGGAQPLASVFAGMCCLAVEVDETRIDKRLETGYLDRKAISLDEAFAMLREALANGEVISIGLLGNAADSLETCAPGAVWPATVPNQTSPHDPMNGYAPVAYSLEAAARRRTDNAKRYVELATASMAKQVRARLALQAKQIPTFDYGNNI